MKLSALTDNQIERIEDSIYERLANKLNELVTTDLSIGLEEETIEFGFFVDENTKVKDLPNIVTVICSAVFQVVGIDPDISSKLIAFKAYDRTAEGQPDNENEMFFELNVPAYYDMLLREIK